MAISDRSLAGGGKFQASRRSSKLYRGSAAGLYNIAQSFSQIVGNYAGGPIAQVFGYPTLFAGAAVALGLGVGYVSVGVKAGDEGKSTAPAPADTRG